MVLLDNMETLISRVLEEGQTLTVKHAAYKLGMDFRSAEAAIRERADELKNQLLCSWITVGNGHVALLVDPDAVPAGSKLFSIQRKPASAQDGAVALNSSLDSVRDDLIKREETGFLRNARGVVQAEGLEVLPAGASVQRTTTSSSTNANESAKPATTSAAAPSSTSSRQKTAADFFRRAPVPSSDESTSRGVASPKKPQVATEVPAASKSPVGKRAEKPTSPDVQTSNKSPAKSINVEQQKARSPAEKSEFDEEESSSSDNDSSDSDESSSLDGPEDKEATTTDGATSVREASVAQKKAKREARSSKRRRVIEDDDEATEEKRKEREARKAQKKLERAAQREREKELKLIRIHEEKEEAKHEFLKTLGVKASTKPGTGKRKVLRTRTFVDEDGFEVTEDVMVEEDIPEVEIDLEPEAPKSKMIASSSAPTPKEKEKKTTTDSSAPAKSAAPKQASLTSFFMKKSK